MHSCDDDGSGVDGFSIANAAINLYHQLPSNGKPKSDEEFTVLAAIVAVVSLPDTNKSTRVLSLATGTKCCGQGF